jgi:hypothetical protein
MNSGTFDFNLFLKESKETLVNPKSYFSSMKGSGGFTEPFIKGLIYGITTGIIYLIFYFLKIQTLGLGYMGNAVGFGEFFRIVISSVIGLFIGAAILLIISSICKGNTDFELNTRVSASLMVVMPIYALLSIFMGIYIYLGFVISLILFIYMLWLLYNGLCEGLKCKKESARIVCYVLIALVVIFSLLELRNIAKVDRFNRDTKRFFRESKK